MRVFRSRIGLAGRLWAPRPSVRLRLTAVYGTLSLLSGAVLLAIADGLAAARSAGNAVPAVGTQTQQSALAQADARIQQLQAQLASRAAVPHQLLLTSLIALSIMTAVSVLLGWVIAGRVLRPIRAMTAATRRISADSLHERLAVAGPDDELKDLADTIDELLMRLEDSFAMQRRFVANASHELRTPLATMRASLDVAMAKPQPVPAQTIALADRMRGELDRIDGLLDGFLTLARAQHRALPGQTVLSFRGVVCAILAARADAMTARNLTVRHAEASDGAWVHGSRPLLCRMTENLIDNAIVHNQDGGWIHVVTDADGTTVRLSVETSGPVLDQRQVAQLAQPFRRLGTDRTGSDNGTGLGLSIVAAIAQAHGGSLDLHARRGGGLRATVTLSQAAEAAPTGAA